MKMVAEIYDISALKRTETIDFRQPKSGEVLCSIEVGMIGMATMNALELVASPASSIPSTASQTVLRSFPWILPFKPNSMFLAAPFEPSSIRSIYPMGQSSVKHAGKLSTFPVLNIPQILNTEDPDICEIDRLESMKHQFFSFRMGVLLALIEGLNSIINGFSGRLPVGENKAIFIIAIHANNFPFGFLWRFWLFEEEINVGSIIFDAKTDGLSYGPSFGQLSIKMGCGFARDDHRRGSAPTKLDSVIKMSSEWLDSYKMAIENDLVPVELWFTPIFCASNDFLGLFGESLSKSGCDVKPISSKVNCRKICKRCRKILTGPEYINKILHDGMTEVDKSLEFNSFVGVKTGKKHATCSSHGRLSELPMSFDH